MKAKNWCYCILIAVFFAVMFLIVSGFCFPGTFTGTITELTDTYFTLQSTEPGVKAQAVAVKWPDTQTVEEGDRVTVWYYRKTHEAPMGLYIYKMEVKAEAEADSSASASVEYGENQSEVRVKHRKRMKYDKKINKSNLLFTTQFGSRQANASLCEGRQVFLSN